VQLCIQNHGPFTLLAALNTEWADNPYNVANGGPLADPRDFFTDPTSRELFRRRLRYIVARWGYSTQILAWELWNEVNLVKSTVEPDVIEWHAEMAGELLTLDPYDHLISTSTSGDPETPIWELPAIGFTQSHIYNPPMTNLVDFLTERASRSRVAGKPHLISETGVDFRGPAETIAVDPEAIGFHDSLWVGLFAETFGTGMSWWWDNVTDPENLYFHFSGVAAAVCGIDFAGQGFTASRPTATATGRELTAYGLLGTTEAIVWVKNLAHQWYPAGPSGDPVPVTAATVTVGGLADGVWRARWIDPYGGAEVAAFEIAVSGGMTTLEAPPFTGDVALRLTRGE
jgi:hypothetical protein